VLLFPPWAAQIRARSQDRVFFIGAYCGQKNLADSAHNVHGELCESARGEGIHRTPVAGGDWNFMEGVRET